MKTWQTTLLVLAILVSSGYASVMVGIYIGRSLAEADFNGPRRDLGRAFTDLKTELQNQNYKTVEQRIDYLATNWHSIDFFRDVSTPTRIPWYRFIHDYEALDNQK
jgi:hypothetical protein